MFPDDNQEIADFGLICPECGVANPENAEYCLVCERDLRNTLLFLEDDSFDLEITSDCIIEYRKNFWGTDRTGKVNKYPLREISNLEFGHPITRFKFDFNGKRHVIPIKNENMDSLKKLLNEILDL
jgi:hypothetical protein